MNDTTVQMLKSLGFDEEYPFVIFRVSDVAYAISSRHIHSMNVLGEVTPVAGGPSHLLGIAKYRDAAIAVLNLRSCFGLENQKEEVERKIDFHQRIKDHDVWVNTLEESVRERKPFTLTDDPHKCAFGRWLDSFETTNNELSMHLRRIVGPHNALHETAKTVVMLNEKGDYDGAMAAVKNMRATHFAETMRLLSEINDAFERGLNNMLIVVDDGKAPYGLLVDELVSVEYFEEVSHKPQAYNDTSIICVANRKGDRKNILVLDGDDLQKKWIVSKQL